MSTRRMVEITCDICGYQCEYTLLDMAWHDGWERDRWPSGELVDLCDECFPKVLPERAKAKANG